MSSRILAVVAACLTLLASGMLYHALAKDSTKLDEAAARVLLVPNVVGEWHGVEVEPDEEAFRQAGAKAYWMRVYSNEKTKESVLAILMCGRSGRMAVHTPEVCYGGAGFELNDAPTTFSFNNVRGEKSTQFWTAHFVKRNGAPKHLRLYWAWNVHGDWEAAATPRWQFRGEPFLYKLYVTRDTGLAPSNGPQADPAADFLRDFLPVLKQTLFPNASQP